MNWRNREYFWLFDSIWHHSNWHKHSQIVNVPNRLLWKQWKKIIEWLISSAKWNAIRFIGDEMTNIAELNISQSHPVGSFIHNSTLFVDLIQVRPWNIHNSHRNTTILNRILLSSWPWQTESRFWHLNPVHAWPLDLIETDLNESMVKIKSGVMKYLQFLLYHLHIFIRRRMTKLWLM
jgi:hypothetical protein